MRRKSPSGKETEPSKTGSDFDLSDDEAFARAMADVVPIKRSRRLIPLGKRPSDRPDQPSDKWRPAADGPGSDPAPLGNLRHGDPRLVKRLRRGEFPVQEDLDLHGFSQVEARRELDAFLLESSRRGLRCVRVIHGKGRNSPDGLSVLRRRVPEWLTSGANTRLVVAFVSAPLQAGGAGALHVLLRKRGA